MENYTKIDPKKLVINPFSSLDDQWLLVTAAKKDGSVNTMTASWGGFGIMWNQPVTYLVLRPQRYTKEFMDDSLKYSLSFFSEDYRKDLNYLGKVSGRDKDKIPKTNLTIDFYHSVPFFKEADLVIFCDTKTEQVLPAERFLDKSLLPKHYPNSDFHHLYIGMISEFFEK